MIARFLMWLFCACRHKWDITEEKDLQDTDGDVIGRVIYLQCYKCGDVSRRELGSKPSRGAPYRF